MKIQCDVCSKGNATVFCPADEAALCDACDNSIHHANKLAGKHARFSLIHPSYKEFPLCDICQERRAFFFCKEDRTILCRECDLSIHKSNEHTQNHNRFLLTGVKLHASSSSHPTSSSSNGSEATIDAENRRPQAASNRSNTVSPSSGKTNLPAYKAVENQITDTLSVATSSISEYLMETLPGWHVEDFLDPANIGFCKTYDDALPFEDQDLERYTSFLPSEDLAIWVPQFSPQFPVSLPQTDFLTGVEESAKRTNVKASSRKWIDDGFTVPQGGPPSLKKSRHF
ncbi:hypothetical protein CJ030_MR7G017459 [Morella rubra]|uniref:B box-type domain-containing protein n=1 Tax=Morella rubra TaxID=262757 RepID=A0A6A1V616_9ROSI|nr:hypothetical protein CJ030_MR7G017459 [Morella rubra]